MTKLDEMIEKFVELYGNGLSLDWKIRLKEELRAFAKEIVGKVLPTECEHDPLAVDFEAGEIVGWNKAVNYTKEKARSLGVEVEG